MQAICIKEIRKQKQMKVKIIYSLCLKNLCLKQTSRRYTGFSEYKGETDEDHHSESLKISEKMLGGQQYIPNFLQESAEQVVEIQKRSGYQVHWISGVFAYDNYTRWS